MNKCTHTRKSGKEFNVILKKARVEKLRALKQRKSPLPNIKAKLWAARILDEINKETIALPEGKESDQICDKCYKTKVGVDRKIKKMM